MNVMTKAWEIAREGFKKFGGKVKEYFAIALKTAWKINKEMDNMAKTFGEIKEAVYAVWDTENDDRIKEFYESTLTPYIKAGNKIYGDVMDEYWNDIHNFGMVKNKITDVVLQRFSKEKVEYVAAYSFVKHTETEKAIMFEILPINNESTLKSNVWLPKSAIKEDGTISDWAIKEKMLVFI